MQLRIQNYIIESYEHGYIVGTVVKAKDSGKEYIKNKVYPSTLEGACKCILEKKLKASDAKTFKELKEAVELAKMEIKEAVNGMA